MGTLVCFHAHPDDECIGTGGVLAMAKADGHRTVLVYGTKGERGEVPDGFLDEGESLGERRVKETHRAAQILGVDRVEFLPYADSGMMGTPENDLDGTFWQADVDAAAEELAAILRDEAADVLVCYDEIGGYGHPDHIQVHRVGVRAGELAATPKVFQMTINRDRLLRMTEEGRRRMEDAGLEVPDFGAQPDFGMPESVITCAVDVSAYIATKRSAMQAHASQIGPDHFMLSMPEDAFLQAFGTEWFIRAGEGPGITETAVI